MLINKLLCIIGSLVNSMLCMTSNMVMIKVK